MRLLFFRVDKRPSFVKKKGKVSRIHHDIVKDPNWKSANIPHKNWAYLFCWRVEFFFYKECSLGVANEAFIFSALPAPCVIIKLDIGGKPIYPPSIPKKLGMTF